MSRFLAYPFLYFDALRHFFYYLLFFFFVRSIMCFGVIVLIRMSFPRRLPPLDLPHKTLSFVTLRPSPHPHQHQHQLSALPLTHCLFTRKPMHKNVHSRHKYSWSMKMYLGKIRQRRRMYVISDFYCVCSYVGGGRGLP
jgi:hypothetical protein